MSDRKNVAIRGTRIGGVVSLETDLRVDGEYEPRRRHTYTCLLGHETMVVFHAEAQPPVEWDCSVCPAAGRHDSLLGQSLETEPRKVGKTHWEQLQGRRTEQEMESLLQEALSNYRKYGKSF